MKLNQSGTCLTMSGNRCGVVLGELSGEDLNRVYYYAQDWQLCQLMPVGVSSRAYTLGPYSGAESLLAQFDREFLRVMGH